MAVSPNLFYEKTCEICYKTYRCGRKGQRTCGKKCMGLLKRKECRIDCICKQCNTVFGVTQCKINEGRGLFCSPKCFHLHNRIQIPEEQVIDLWNQGLSCGQISDTLNISPYPLKSWLTKKGIYEIRRKGKNHGLYKEGVSCSKTVKLEVIKRAGNKCEKCGYDKYPKILQFHHKDRNRTNNATDNLLLLCPNCHEVEHYLSGDGRWKNSTKVVEL